MAFAERLAQELDSALAAHERSRSAISRFWDRWSEVRVSTVEPILQSAAGLLRERGVPAIAERIDGGIRLEGIGHHLLFFRPDPPQALIECHDSTDHSGARQTFSLASLSSGKSVGCLEAVVSRFVIAALKDHLRRE